jgi:hypothetical protein|nr:MAG TPA: hypothetical protein [Caudoviricetes sp.]
MGSLWVQTYRLNPSKPSSQESRGFNHGSVNYFTPKDISLADYVADDETEKKDDTNED